MPRCRLLIRVAHPQQGLLTDDGLVQHHVRQERTQGVFLRAAGLERGLDAFGYGDTQRARMLRILRPQWMLMTLNRSQKRWTNFFARSRLAWSIL